MNYSDLNQRIHAHPGMPYQRLLFTYQHSKNILGGNLFELQMFIHKLESGELERAVGVEDFRRRFHDFDGILIRYLHNFFSAVKSLIDHTRALMIDPIITAAYRLRTNATVSLFKLMRLHG